MGKAPSFILVAVLFVGVLAALLATKFLTGDQFVSAFEFVVTTFFASSAAASFRDVKKPSNGSQ